MLPGTLMQQNHGFRTAAAALGKPKVAVAETPPPGWKWGPDQKANSREYNSIRKQHTRAVADLRNKWWPLVLLHERKVRHHSVSYRRLQALCATSQVCLPGPWAWH
jgi:hypothetical protein